MICKKCHKNKPKKDFKFIKDRRFGSSYYSGNCTECEKEYQKKYRENKK